LILDNNKNVLLFLKIAGRGSANHSKSETDLIHPKFAEISDEETLILEGHESEVFRISFFLYLSFLGFAFALCCSIF